MIKKKLNSYRKNPLLKNFSLVVLARFSNAFLFFLVTFFLMKSLTQEDYGKFNDFYSTVAVFTFLVNLGLDRSFVTATSKIVNKDRFLNYVGLFWRLKFLIFSVFTIFLSIYYFVFEDIYFVLCALTGFTFGLSEGIKPLAESQKKFNIISALVPIRNIIILLGLLGLFFGEEFNLKGIYLLFLGANILNFFVFFFAYKSKISTFTLKTTLKPRLLLTFTRWIFVKDFFNVFVANLEILVMGRLIFLGYVDSIELGIYAGAFSLCRVLSVITNSLTNVLLPEVAGKTNKNSLKKFLNQLKKSSFIIVPLCALFYMAMILLTRIIFGEKYAESEGIFPLVIIGTIFAFYANNISLIFYRSKTLAFIGRLTIIKFIIGLLLSIILIPQFGAIGAGLSFLIVRFFDLIVVIFRSTKFLNNSLQQI